MQYLYRELWPQSQSHLEDGYGVQDGNASLDRFDYRRICFGSQLDLPQMTDRIIIMSEDTATAFLDTFLGTIQPIFKTPSVSDMRTGLKCLVSPESPAFSQPLEKAVMLLVLAIGAILNGQQLWGQKLFDAAEDHAKSWLHVLNVHAVLLTILIISHPCHIPSTLLIGLVLLLSLPFMSRQIQLSIY